MARLLRHLLLLCFLLFINEVFGSENFIVRDGRPDHTLLPKRRLSAAKRTHELGARGVEGCLKYDHDLHYLDGRYGPLLRLF